MAAVRKIVVVVMVMVVAVPALSAMVLAANPQAATPYGVGFTWNRWADWKPGTDDRSSDGNPCKDSAGNTVWSAEYILDVPDGSDLDSSDGVAPWYTLPSSGLMVWDGHWSGGTWAKLYDNPPTASRHGLGHIPNDQSYNGNHYANVPLLRWKNPSAEQITVSLTAGSERFSGVLSMFMPTGATADLMIGWTDASDGDSVHLLYSATIVKTAAADVKQSIALPKLAINALVLNPGDSIIFSIRSRSRTTGFKWASVSFLDDVNITVVPDAADGVRVPGARDGIGVELLDGTRITGKLKLDQIAFDTAYGTLKFPIADLVGLRPGMDSRPDMAERVGSLIAALGSATPQERDQAQKDLIEMGPMLKLIVAERAGDDDPERRTRVGQILKAYETWAAEHPGAPRSSTVPMGRQDQIQTSSFAMKGTIAHKQLRLETDYGTFKLDLSQIYKVRIARVRRTDKATCYATMELRDGSRVKGRLEPSKLRMNLPYGEASIPIPLLQTVTVREDRKAIDVTLRSDDRLKGSVNWPDKLKLKTAFGTLIIPPEEVTRIDMCAANAVPPKGLASPFPVPKLDSEAERTWVSIIDSGDMRVTTLVLIEKAGTVTGGTLYIEHPRDLSNRKRYNLTNVRHEGKTITGDLSVGVGSSKTGTKDMHLTITLKEAFEGDRVRAEGQEGDGEKQPIVFVRGKAGHQ